MPAVPATRSKLPPRKDPPPRNAQGVAAWANVKRREEGRHYVLVYQGDRDSMANYEAMGYRVERYRFKKDAAGKIVLDDFGQPIPEGVHVGVMTGRKEGDPIVERDHVLMSVDAERYREIVEYGQDGDTGQAMVTELENKMLQRRGFDPLRGMGGIRRGTGGGAHFDIVPDQDHGEQTVESD